MTDSLALSPLPGGGFDWTLPATHGLALRATIDPDSPVLADFYAGYDKAFVLPREREELQGFKDCLALGAGPAFEELSARYGPFREAARWCGSRWRISRAPARRPAAWCCRSAWA